MFLTVNLVSDDTNWQERVKGLKARFVICKCISDECKEEEERNKYEEYFSLMFSRNVMRSNPVPDENFLMKFISQTMSTYAEPIVEWSLSGDNIVWSPDYGGPLGYTKHTLNRISLELKIEKDDKEIGKYQCTAYKKKEYSKPKKKLVKKLSRHYKKHQKRYEKKQKKIEENLKKQNEYKI